MPKLPVFQCDICCEMTAKMVACPMCVKEACTFCVRRYILSQPTSEAQCMHCHAVWDRDVLMQLLPKAFVDGDSKRHREQVLYDQCRAMLPGLQTRAQNMKAARTLEAINRDMRVRLTELHDQHNRLRNTIRADAFALKYYDDNDAIKQLTENRIKSMLQDKNRMFDDICGMQRTVEENTRVIHYIQETGEMPEANGVSKPVAKEAPTFICGCPGAECRGFMKDTGSQLVCGVCSLEACAKCHEPLRSSSMQSEPLRSSSMQSEPLRSDPQETGHVCRKENIETANLLKKDTRPCPKCSVPIFKINGCDQMWCVLCQTTFSWNTGEISEGRVHNPHYYEWMRRNHGEVPREPGDVPGGHLGVAPGGHLGAGGCEGLVRMSVLSQWLRKIDPDYYQDDDLYALADTHRELTHISQVEVARFAPEPRREQLFQTPLVRFLLNELDETVLKRELHKKDKENQQKRGVQQVLQMLVAACSDVFHTTLAAHPEPTMADAEDLKTQLATIRAFANEALARHKAIYSYTPWVVDERWKVVSYTKYIKNQEK